MIRVIFVAAGTTFQSSASAWKQCLTMNDPNFLPVPPIFVVNKKYTNQPLIDLLSFSADESLFNASFYIDNLNRNNDTSFHISSLKDKCKNGTSHACLILGRIYEFGAYGFSENISASYAYYNRVSELNDTSSLSSLSFFHKYYYTDLQRSVVEEDIAVNHVDTKLSSGFEYGNGFIRPQSLNSAANSISSVAEFVSRIYSFPREWKRNSTEISRLENSTHPHDQHLLGLHFLSSPYLSFQEAKTAFLLLNSSFSAGNVESGPFLAYLYQSGLGVDENITNAFLILQNKCDENDPWRQYFLSNIISLIFHTDLGAQLSSKYLINAVKSGHLPAIHRLAEYTYYGLLGNKRSNKKAYEIFQKAAANGYPQSIVSAANQLVGGDGILVDKEKAIEMMFTVVESAPWMAIYDKYVERGSTHAFLRMLDMGLTPKKWIPPSKPNDVTKALLNLTKRNRRIVFTDEGLKRSREAEAGDDISMLWMALNTNFTESLQWIEKMRLLKPPASIVCKFAWVYIIFMAAWKAVKGEMADEELKLLLLTAEPICEAAVIVITAAALFGFLSLRVSMIFP